MRSTRLMSFAASAALAIAGVSGCGEDGAGDQSVSSPASTTEAEETGSPGGDAASGDAVQIVEFEFEPEAIKVPAGTTITFTNEDKAPHTATADDSSFDTETLQKGDSAEETFDEPGTYTYYCRFHVFMKGSVEVE